MSSIVNNTAVELDTPSGHAGSVNVLDASGGTKLASPVVAIDETGSKIDFATQTTLSQLKTVADNLLTAIQSLDTSNINGTVALDSVSLNALETVTVGGSVAVSNFTDNGLTDTQLRATELPVTDSAISALLTTLLGSIKNHNDPFVDGSAGQVILGKRRDSDTTLVADGDLNTFNMDEEGRLKVSSKPASYPDITGDITAIQATINTPVAGGTVAGDVSRASNIMAFCTGTFAGINVTFEGSLEASGDSNWFGVQAVRSNANTIETSTGVLSAQPVYGWELSVNALKRVRVRATARTSGTQSWRFVQGTYATEPIPAAQVSATQPVSGTVTVNGTVTITLPATTALNVISLATINLTSVKATAGSLFNLTYTNTAASIRYLKLYNKASAPVVASDIPILTIPLAVGSFASIPFGTLGRRFATGIAFAITGAAADTDATAIGAGEVKFLIDYI